MPRFAPALAAALLGVGMSLAAQRPGSWVPLSLGSPVVPTNIHQLGKTCTYLEAGKLWFFSGFTRTWKSIPVSTSAGPATVANDMAYVRDGGQLHAFSSYRGTIETLNVSATATVVNPSAQRNDSILCVVDANVLWTFSCFRGVWTSLALASPSPRIATQRHAVVVADGTTFRGMSAFHGNWISTNSAFPATTAAADGSWGMIETAAIYYGFSATRNSWSTAPALASGAQRLVEEDCIVHWDNNIAIAYTGLRGGFATTAIPGTATVSGEALVVAIQAGTNLRLYSAVLNQWTSTSTLGVAAITIRPHLVSWNDAGTVGAYSPFHGTVATAPAIASADASNQGVAAVVDANATRLFLFSTLTGTWVQAPANAVVTLPDMIWCGALLRTNTGFLAFSGRSGRFVALPASAGAIKWIDNNSSVLAVEDGNTLHVYEPRRETWLQVAKSSSAPWTVRIWRTTLLAIDGATVHGYGTLSGQIESYTLPAPPTEFNANSESVRAGVGTTLALFGATPDCVTLYQFPEFRRVYATGAQLEVQLHGAPGSAVWGLLSSIAAVPLSLPPYGELLLDTASLSATSLGTLPADGRVTWTFVVPDLAVLRGLEPAFQGLVQPVSGTPYLTRMASVRLQ